VFGSTRIDDEYVLNPDSSSRTSCEPDDNRDMNNGVVPISLLSTNTCAPTGRVIANRPPAAFATGALDGVAVAGAGSDRVAIAGAGAAGVAGVAGTSVAGG